MRDLQVYQLEKVGGQPPHCEYLDAIRGWAILAVVCVHVQYCVGWFPSKEIFASGNYGVQLFFLLSAFTICLSSFDRFASEERPALSYLSRRAFRILPLWWFAILLHTITHLNSSTGNEPSFNRVFATALFINAWNPQAAQEIVMGGWSIAVEVSIYCFLPIVFLTCRNMRHAMFIMGITIVLAKTGPLLEYLWRKGLQIDPPIMELAGPFSALSNAPAFAMGILLFFAFREKSTDGASKWILAVGQNPYVMAMAITMLLVLPYLEVRVVPRVLIYSLLFAIILCYLRRKPIRAIVNPITIYLGKISYSCYVNHFVVLSFLAAIGRNIGLHFKSESYVNNAGYFAVIFCVTIGGTTLVSAATYKYIEQPGVSFGRALHKRLGRANL